MVEAIELIAKKHNLKVIYDAAHAFGVKCHCGSILNHGDLSILSFHATKAFNTFEGGAIISPNLETKLRIDSLKNFGIESDTAVKIAGINGKMSEFNAALGILQLKYFEDVVTKRKQIAQTYQSRLEAVEGIEIVGPFEQLQPNYSYFPILVTDKFRMTRDELFDSLKIAGIYTRRYFYPLISTFSMYQHLPSSDVTNLSVAHDASRQILCLPIYPGLETALIDKICSLISTN